MDEKPDAVEVPKPRGRGRPRKIKGAPTVGVTTGETAEKVPETVPVIMPKLTEFVAVRYIGVRHRCKLTAKGEVRPTAVDILAEGAATISYELGTETSEFDFARGFFPTSYRPLEEKENVSDFPRPWQLQTEKVKDKSRMSVLKERVASDRDTLRAGKVVYLADLDLNVKLDAKGELVVVTKIPVTYDGLKRGDLVGMALGGSGDALACLFSQYGSRCGALVARLPTYGLTEARMAQKFEDKENDAEVLAATVRDHRDRFYAVTEEGRDLLRVSLRFAELEQAMSLRISTNNRLIGQYRVEAYTTMDPGTFPNRDVESQHRERIANEPMLAMLEEREKAAERELLLTLRRVSVYTRILNEVEGIGTRLAGRIIAAVGDYRRFFLKLDSAALRGFDAEIKQLQMEGGLFELRPNLATEIAADTSGKSKGQLWWEATRQATRTLEGQLHETSSRQLVDKIEKLTRAAELFGIRSQLKRKTMQKSRDRFISYCGLNPDPITGQFRRHRRADKNGAEGKSEARKNNWKPGARQAGWLFGKQVLIMPKSYWGQRLIAAKVEERRKHPEPIKSETGKNRFTPGHIQNRAVWKVGIRFFQWLFNQLWNLSHHPDSFVLKPPPPLVAVLSEPDPSVDPSPPLSA